MRVAVLGCGPAGLMAVHGLRATGLPLDAIDGYSRKRKSHINGAQYLHAPIPVPSVDQRPVRVKYHLNGSAEAYRRKVYGASYNGPVSPEDLPEEHDAWDLRATYNALWALYEKRFQDVLLTPRGVADLLDKGLYQLIISAVPRDQLCLSDDHKFDSQTVYAVGDAPELNQYAPVTLPDFFIQCNALESPRWYRAARVFGYTTVEWPGGPKPPVERVARVEKPLSTTCDCHPNLRRVGRYGVWSKTAFSHEAYGDAMMAVEYV